MYLKNKGYMNHEKDAQYSGLQKDEYLSCALAPSKQVKNTRMLNICSPPEWTLWVDLTILASLYGSQFFYKVWLKYFLMTPCIRYIRMMLGLWSTLSNNQIVDTSSHMWVFQSTHEISSFSLWTWGFFTVIIVYFNNGSWLSLSQGMYSVLQKMRNLMHTLKLGFT